MRLIFQTSVLALSGTVNAFSPSERNEFGGYKINPDCTDLNLGEVCTEICIDDMIDCINKCQDDDCKRQCARDEAICVDECPCHAECYEGCNDCENPICQCQGQDIENNFDYKICTTEESVKLGNCNLGCDYEFFCVRNCTLTFYENIEFCPCKSKCPGGCPCDSYTCYDYTTTPVLPTTTSPMIYQWDAMRSSYTTVINGTIAGQDGGVAQAYMKESLLDENAIYTWSLKVLYLTTPDSQTVAFGMASSPPAHGASDWDLYDYRTLVYRCFNGRVYGTSKGEVQIDKCTVGDIITFTYDRRQRHFYIQKNDGTRYLVEDQVNAQVPYFPMTNFYNAQEDNKVQIV